MLSCTIFLVFFATLVSIYANSVIAGEPLWASEWSSTDDDTAFSTTSSSNDESHDASDFSAVLHRLIPELGFTSEMIAYVKSWAELGMKLSSFSPNEADAVDLAASSRFLPMEAAEDDTFQRDIDAADSKAASEADAYSMARYAAAAYCLSSSNLRNWKCSNHCQDQSTAGTQVLDLYSEMITGTKFFSAINHRTKSVVISFRGTLHPASILADLAFQLKPYRGHPEAPLDAMAHTGFLIAFASVAERIRRTVIDAIKKFDAADITPDAEPIRVDITGHSMGGALAVLGALDLDAHFSSPGSTVSAAVASRVQFRVFSYGSPRIGNPQFAAFAAARPRIMAITRVTYNYDPIPRLPPRSIGYRHQGTEMYLSGWWFGDNQTGGIWQAIRNWVRDSLGWEPKVRTCQDGGDEDPTCINADPFIPVNIVSHLRYWSITMGPWCI